MAVSPGYKDYVLEQLERVGPVSAKRMFGGVGLYCDALFFGLIDDDQLYLKADDQTRARFEERGCTAFQPMPGKASMNYFSVPEDVIEDPAELAKWARDALAAASRKAR